MSSIINKSKWIVTVKRRPDLTRAFPHYKGVGEAQAYKQQLLSEDKLVADIARGPLTALCAHPYPRATGAIPARSFL